MMMMMMMMMMTTMGCREIGSYLLPINYPVANKASRLGLSSHASTNEHYVENHQVSKRR